MASVRGYAAQPDSSFRVSQLCSQLKLSVCDAFRDKEADTTKFTIHVEATDPSATWMVQFHSLYHSGFLWLCVAWAVPHCPILRTMLSSHPVFTLTLVCLVMPALGSMQ